MSVVESHVLQTLLKVRSISKIDHVSNLSWLWFCKHIWWWILVFNAISSSIISKGLVSKGGFIIFYLHFHWKRMCCRLVQLVVNCKCTANSPIAVDGGLKIKTLIGLVFSNKEGDLYTRYFTWCPISTTWKLITIKP